MTREEARNILGEGASETQVTNMLNTVQNEIKNYQDEITAFKDEKKSYEAQITDFKTKLSEANKYKEELEKIKNSKMTDQELIEQQKKEAQSLLDSAKLISNTAKVKNILAGEEITDEQIASLIDKDENISINRANMFKTILNNARETTEKKVKGELTHLDITPNLTNIPQNNNVVKLDDFLNMSAEEQEKFAETNPNEYNSLIN